MRTLHYGLCPPLKTPIIAFLNSVCSSLTTEQHCHILLNCDAFKRGSTLQALPRRHGFRSRQDVFHVIAKIFAIHWFQSPTEMMKSAQCFGSQHVDATAPECVIRGEGAIAARPARRRAGISVRESTVHCATRKECQGFGYKRSSQFQT